MTKLLLALALSLCVAAPIAAQSKDAAPKDPKAAEKKDDKKEDKAEVDHLKLFRTKGNSWTFKLKDGTFERHEVSEVTEKRASVKLSTLDKDKKETAFDFYSVVLKDAKKPDKPATPSKSEEVEYTAGDATLDCLHNQYFSSGGTLHQWFAKDWSLLVKEEWVSKSGTETRRELVEFSAK